ncbi:MAG TPA: hypothetical protein VHM28_12520 [Anaerolineales bacterium]|nr:hypothetical protein [Anaerolineales bacterium]
MKNRGNLFLFSFVALIVMVGLACGTNPTPAPQPPASSSSSSSESSSGNSGETTTFTDQNKYYSIDVPADWKYEQTTDKQSNNYYIDTFTSPDGNAVIENIAYDDGTAFQGSDESKFGLYLLNTFYSKTGKEGDIRISEEKQQQDGSDRLTWTSKGGGYSGFSYLEVRNGSTFLMFTVDWGNDYEDQYLDTLNAVIDSYRLP